MARHIVLAGTSGVRKRKVAEQLASLLLAHHTNWSADKVQIVAVEHHLDVAEMLASATPTQMQALEECYSETLEQLKKPAMQNAEIILIPLHFTFVHYDRAFSPLAWPAGAGSHPASRLLSFLNDIQPECIVTLIDDVHYIQDELIRGSSRVDLRLREILKWREFETLVADYSANAVIRHSDPARRFIQDKYERSPIFAVQHDCEMVRRYLFEPATPRVYCSFPISRVRRANDADRVGLFAQINQFTSELSKAFVVFNPLTIDEVPLNIVFDGLRIFQAAFGGDLPETIEYATQLWRWDVPGAKKLRHAPVSDTLKLRLSDLAEVSAHKDPEERSIVRRQVESRDFRLIDQSDCVAIYRPTSPVQRPWSGGVLNEYNYALQSVMARGTFMQIYIVRSDTDEPLGQIVDTGGATFRQSQNRVKIIEGFGDLDDGACRTKALNALIAQISHDKERLTQRRLVR